MKTTHISIALIVLLIIAAAGLLRYELYTPASHNTADVHVSIEPGTSLNGMAEILKTQGVIRSPLFFTLYARFSGKSVKLQAGEYEMPLNLKIPQVVERLATGKGSSNDVPVTIPEGYNNTQVMTAVIAAGVDMSPEAFADATSHGYVGDASDWIYDGKPETADLTGYLFPDTYKLYGNSTAQAVVEKMVGNFRSKVTDDMHQSVNASGYTFYQLLTLASIVEKEVKTPEERKIVAGIFLQRLADNYPLESDATVNFITGKKDTTPSADDVAVVSAYNTYAHAGLPPTPICNPGIDAIEAVLNPTKTEYYFFLTTPDGKALYSQTYEQHLQKKAQYYP